MNSFLQKAKAVVLGHAIGDALGVPVEFKSREELKACPVSDMQGFGTHNKPVGTWSDDTSMALCTLESLSKGKIDFDDIMQNFGKWYFEGQFTPNGSVFGVGKTCEDAINRYFKEKRPFNKCGRADEGANGNGSLMRIHPIVLYLLYEKKNVSFLPQMKTIGAASALTHAHPRSKVACNIYASILANLIKNPNKESIKFGIQEAYVAYKSCHISWGVLNDEFSELNHFSRLNDIEKLDESQIFSDGYVVHTLEAALWCLLTTNNFKDCVLKAVNLGGDTDTIAAIAGGLAGALYGINSIPQDWLNTLLKEPYIESLCTQTFKE